MPIMPFVIICLIVLIVVLVGWIISFQRKLVHADELCGNAMSSIGVQLTSRWDAVTALVKLAEKYAAHESEALKGIIAMRRPVTGQTAAADAQQQEDVLNQTLSRIVALSETYPTLKADALYLSTMDGLKNSENQVRMSRMVYNDTVTKLNRLVRMFPGNLFAGMLGFSLREYLQMDSAKSEMPDLGA